ncbi:PAS domain-containing sensor histidine kinase [Draconibacterium sediminis]|uniref:PAS domain-containing sensor histidine kinase n=1 Tax=Draconibacterium sediminis TaxID=1544798 RepID=UPI0026EDE329|nr:PAS domain-containing sensor histidine kinase [Draconibacterium sediminis]
MRFNSKPGLFTGITSGMSMILLLSFIHFLFLKINPFTFPSLALSIVFGGITGFFIALLINKNQKKNRSIQESEIKFRTLIDLSLDGIYVENERGEILDCNTMGHKMFGYTREEMLQLSIRDLVPDEFAEMLPDIIPEEMATGEVYVERVNKKKDGTIFPTEINTKFINLNGDKRLIVYVRDITERKKAENELKELIASKNKLFSVIGHDLRGFYSNIVSFSDILLTESGLEKEQDQQFLSHIQQSAKQADELLQNILDWASLETNQIKFNPVLVSLSKIIAVVSQQVSNRAELKGVRIISQVPDDLSIYTDKKFLGPILRNLLANAIKYSFEKGNIYVDCQINENDTPVISVKDEGTGMNPDKLQNIFREGTAESLPGTGNEKGTGLGLKICKDFTEKLKGNIYVKSATGKGSTFYIELPQPQQTNGK